MPSGTVMKRCIAFGMALFALIAAVPSAAQIEIDPEALPPWDKVLLTQRTAFDIPTLAN